MRLQAKEFGGNTSSMNVAELPVRIDREKIAEFCRARGIRKLSVFGSVLRDDFDPARSLDADFDEDREAGNLNGERIPEIISRVRVKHACRG